MIRTITATEYVTPLREGGSLPAIVSGDDDGTYVVKFRGAGQGVKALIAELVSGEIARLLGLPVPEIVFVEIDPRLAKTEPDPEIQDLLRKSAGLNLGLDYLPGSITFDPMVERVAISASEPRLASSIVWFDSFVTNVDRTARNTNLLVWHRKLWMIDHGATLIFHHTWTDHMEKSRASFAGVKDHVLLRWARALRDVDGDLAALLTPDAIHAVLGMVPDQWFEEDTQFTSTARHRAAYAEVLLQRLQSPREWLEEAVRAHAARV